MMMWENAIKKIAEYTGERGNLSHVYFNVTDVGVFVAAADKYKAAKIEIDYSTTHDGYFSVHKDDLWMIAKCPDDLIIEGAQVTFVYGSNHVVIENIVEKSEEKFHKLAGTCDTSRLKAKKFLKCENLRRVADLEGGFCNVYVKPFPEGDAIVFEDIEMTIAIMEAVEN